MASSQKPVPLPRRSSAEKRKNQGELVSEGAAPPADETIQIVQFGGEILAPGGQEPWGTTGDKERRTLELAAAHQIEGAQTLPEDKPLDLGDIPRLPLDEQSQGPNLPHPPGNDVQEEVPPALPVKRSPRSQSRRVIAPQDDIIFELEDEPIPGIVSGTPVPEDIPLVTTVSVSEATDSPGDQLQPSHPADQIAPLSHSLTPPLGERDATVVSDVVEEKIEVAPLLPLRTNSAKNLLNSSAPSPPTDTVEEAVPLPPVPHRTDSAKRLSATTPPLPPLPDKEPDQTGAVPPSLPSLPNKEPDQTGAVPPSLPSLPNKEPDQTGAVPPSLPSLPNKEPDETGVVPPPPLLPNKEPDETGVVPPLLPPLPDKEPDETGAVPPPLPPLPNKEPDETGVVPPPPQRTNSNKTMPEAPTPSELPQLPTKEPEETATAPPPAPHQADSAKNMPEQLSEVQPPQLPEREPEETEIISPPPPPPPHRTSSVKAMPQQSAEVALAEVAEETELTAQETSVVQNTADISSRPADSMSYMPPLPPKKSPPTFTPPPPPTIPPPPISPPPSSPPQEHKSPASESSHPPELPPKTSETPPPPPPISERYDTEDSSDFLSDSDDEHQGKYRSITSTSLSLKSPVNDDVLAVITASPEEEGPPDNDLVSPLTPLSSEEGTPRRISQIHAPLAVVGEANDIMVISPEPPQIVEPSLKMATDDFGKDYANQEVIDEVVGGAFEGDYADNRKIGTIRGATPIRSRTLTPERSDYVNQELLMGDIIPVALAVPSGDAALVFIPGSMGLRVNDVEQRQTVPDYANINTILSDVGTTTTDGSVNSHSHDECSQLTLRQTSGCSSVANRRSMSPLDDGETALDFHEGSPHHTLGSELVPVRSVPGSGCSSGATTPGCLSLESIDDYFDEKPAEAHPPILPPDIRETKPRAITRATVRESGSHNPEVRCPHLV